MVRHCSVGRVLCETLSGKKKKPGLVVQDFNPTQQSQVGAGVGSGEGMGGMQADLL